MKRSPISGTRHRKMFPLGMAVAGLCLLAGALGSGRGVAAQAPAPAAGRVDFNWDVRPILSDNCFRCHGAADSSRQAGLRLDIPEGAYAELRGRAGRRAITPGRPDESEVVRRITAPTAAARMPPPHANKTLSQTQIETLRRWIEQGAEYKPHWAFITPQNGAAPQVRASGRVVNDIDRWVIARLEREGLGLSPETDKETLINRVTLTLTGLPPTLAEVDAFVRDTSPNAYEKVVDRLLASPAYGEHMFTFWADLARWSESDGFLDDHHDRLLWPWRDWVIGAFNRNMAFNQFGTWQLAGDLLPNRTKEQLLATAFLRVGKRTTENGAIDEEYRVEYMVDRTDTVGTTFLGLTVGCARCHDHKYDPISHKDYYSLAGFFNHVDEPGFYPPGFSGVQGGPTLLWTDAETEGKLATIRSRIASAEADVRRARTAAESDAVKAVEQLLGGAPEAVASHIQASIARGLAAYYAFDQTEPLDEAKIPAGPAAEQLPAELAEIRGPQQRGRFGGQGQAQAQAQEAAEVPGAGGPPNAGRGRGQGQGPGGAAPNAARGRGQGGAGANAGGGNFGANFGGLFGAQGMGSGLVRDESVLSPSGLPGGAYAVLMAPDVRPGVKGNAMFFTETNRGVIRNVGRYDRSQAFSVDLWFYPGQQYTFAPSEVYRSVPVINQKNGSSGGNVGYWLQLDEGYLWFYLSNSMPARMIALKTRERLPVQAWSHITLTYDGSSRAAGAKIYVNGKEAAVDVDHDTLEGAGTILPKSYMGGDNVGGMMFGTRFREKAPVGSGLDELRVFARALTPLEVEYLDAPDRALTDRDALRRKLVEVAVAGDARVLEAEKVLERVRREESDLVSRIPQVLVMGDTPRPRTVYRLDRGLYSERREELQAQALDRVYPWNDALPRNRVGLAQWLFDPRHPLTSRVFVNRIWQMHFGRGLVDTAEDFGTQGSNPSHPELLDSLAVTFTDSGWDIKRLHKMVVMSATYRQSSEAPDALLQRDANNVLLARYTRRRMSTEVLRDSTLAVSGLLVSKVGGPSVFPYQPTDIWNPLNTTYRYPEATAIPAEHHHRRSLYTFVKRNATHPGMQIFDFPDRSLSKARRQISNTPLQALELINDPQYAEAYRVLATRTLASAADPDTHLETMFRLSTRRQPLDQELSVLREYYRAQQAAFAAETSSADTLLANTGVTPLPANVDRVQLAALTRVAALIMNSPDAYSIR